MFSNLIMMVSNVTVQIPQETKISSLKNDSLILHTIIK